MASVDIAGDRFYLMPGHRGAADFNTYNNFVELYGKPTEDAIIAIIKLFSSPLPPTKKGFNSRISTLSGKEQSLINTAIEARIKSIDEAQKYMIKDTVVYDTMTNKKNRMRSLLVQLKAPNTVNTIVTNAIVIPTLYQGLINDKKDITSKHDIIFETILRMAYYLANPTHLIETRADKQDIVNKFEDVLQILQKGNINDIVSSIRATSVRQDIQGMNAMNFFDRMSMKKVLTASDEPVVVQMAKDQIGNDTLEEVMSQQILGILQLLHVQKYIDAQELEIVKDAIKDANTIAVSNKLDTILTGLSGELVPANTSELLKNLTQSFEPIYKFYKQTYDPVFSDLENKLNEDNDTFQFDDMVRVLNIGLQVYNTSKVSDKSGIYKIQGLSDGFIKYIDTITNNISISNRAFYDVLPYKIVQELGQKGVALSNTPKIQFYVHDDIVVPKRENILIEKLDGIKSAEAAGTTSKPSKNPTNPTNPKSSENPKPLIGGGPIEFTALTNYFTQGSAYMFVLSGSGSGSSSSSDKSRTTKFKPFLVSTDNKPIPDASLAFYNKLNLTDVITLRPPPVPVNIVILALSVLILFRGRLQKAIGVSK